MNDGNAGIPLASDDADMPMKRVCCQAPRPEVVKRQCAVASETAGMRMRGRSRRMSRQDQRQGQSDRHG